MSNGNQFSEVIKMFSQVFYINYMHCLIAVISSITCETKFISHLINYTSRFKLHANKSLLFSKHARRLSQNRVQTIIFKTYDFWQPFSYYLPQHIFISKKNVFKNFRLIWKKNIDIYIRVQLKLLTSCQWYIQQH